LQEGDRDRIPKAGEDIALDHRLGDVQAGGVQPKPELARCQSAIGRPFGDQEEFVAEG
jgi:hypothetical protein